MTDTPIGLCNCGSLPEDCACMDTLPSPDNSVESKARSASPDKPAATHQPLLEVINMEVAFENLNKTLDAEQISDEATIIRMRKHGSVADLEAFAANRLATMVSMQNKLDKFHLAATLSVDKVRQNAAAMYEAVNILKPTDLELLTPILNTAK